MLTFLSLSAMKRELEIDHEPEKKAKYGKQTLEVVNNENETKLEPLSTTNAQDSEGNSRLMALSVKGNKEKVELLLSKGADPNLSNKNGVTLLMFASQNGHKDAVDLLLKANSIVDLQDNYGNTALNLASSKGHNEIVKLLLNSGANPNLPNKNGLTPLMCASLNDHKDVVELLLKANSIVDLQDNYDNTALNLASSKGHNEIVKLLLINAANPKLHNKNGDTALIFVSGANVIGRSLFNAKQIVKAQKIIESKEIIENLLRAGATIKFNINKKLDGDEISQLISEAEKGNKDVVKLLLQARADVNAKTKNGKTALISAVASGQKKIVELLLIAQAKVNDQDSSARSALFYTMSSDMLELLLRAQANIDLQDKCGATALAFALINKRKDLAEMLLKKGANPELSSNWHVEAITPLMIESIRGNKETIELLLEANVNVNAQASNGMTALSWALLIGHKEIAVLLLEKKANPSLTYDVKDTQGIIRLVNEFIVGYQEMVENSLKVITHIYTNATEITPLSFAVSNGQKEIIKLLLKNGAELNKNESEENITPLMRASYEGFKEIVELLIKAKADINSEDSYGKTALVLASEKGHRDVVEILLNNQADPNLTYISDFGEDTPLLQASDAGFSEIVELLLNANANANAQCENGWTALAIAAVGGHRRIIELLLDNNANPNLTHNYPNAQENVTTLMEASSLGFTEIVELLLKANANVNAQDTEGSTALSNTAFYGHPDTLSTLVSHGASIDLAEKCLMSAITESNSLECVSLLLGINPQISNKSSIAAIKLLLSNCYKKGEINKMIKKQRSKEIASLVNLSMLPTVKPYLQNPLEYFTSWHEEHRMQRTKEKQTILMLAAMFGHIEIVRSILLIKIPKWFINAWDEKGRTALHYAILYGYFDIALTLIPYCDNGVNITDNKGETPLYYAIKKGNLKIINKLLEFKAKLALSEHQASKALKVAAALGYKEITIKLLAILSQNFPKKNERVYQLFQ